MRLLDFIGQQLKTITLLTEQHPAHSFSILILVYCFIDQLSWLNTKKEKHDFGDFRDWVDKYLLSNCELNCSAEELWAARNAVVHMGTTDSVRNRNGVTKLGYSYGLVTGNAEILGHKIIDMPNLVLATLSGATYFMEELENDLSKMEVANEKLKKVLSVMPVA